MVSTITTPRNNTAEVSRESATKLPGALGAGGVPNDAPTRAGPALALPAVATEVVVVVTPPLVL